MYYRQPIVCIGNHTTNQSAYIPLIGCISIQLRAE